MAEPGFEPMKSGSKATTFPGIHLWMCRRAWSPSPPWRSGAGSAAGTACQGTAARGPPLCLRGRRCWTLAGGLCPEDGAAGLRGRDISHPPCLCPGMGVGRRRHSALPRPRPAVLCVTVCQGGWGGVGGMPGGKGWGKGPRPLTLIVPAVELVELLCELDQGLLDGLGAGH